MPSCSSDFANPDDVRVGEHAHDQIVLTAVGNPFIQARLAQDNGVDLSDLHLGSGVDTIMAPVYSPCPGMQGNLVLRVGLLIDSNGGAPVRDAIVRVEDGRITARTHPRRSAATSEC
jgi:hypothetical protein